MIDIIPGWMGTDILYHTAKGWGTNTNRKNDITRLKSTLVFQKCIYKFGTFSRSPTWEEGWMLSYTPCLLMKAVLFLRFDTTQSQPCFPTASNPPSPAVTAFSQQCRQSVYHTIFCLCVPINFAAVIPFSCEPDSIFLRVISCLNYSK